MICFVITKPFTKKEKIICNYSAVIPESVWAVGFAHEQPLRDATLP
ncbi:MAG: hypothetical protein LBJ00_18620 [Planctomycetaceae bacterium]|nr:hypothetical protein [Planctomycetaceae bacterium]